MGDATCPSQAKRLRRAFLLPGWPDLAGSPADDLRPPGPAAQRSRTGLVTAGRATVAQARTGPVVFGRVTGGPHRRHDCRQGRAGLSGNGRTRSRRPAGRAPVAQARAQCRTRPGPDRRNHARVAGLRLPEVRAMNARCGEVREACPVTGRAAIPSSRPGTSGGGRRVLRAFSTACRWSARPYLGPARARPR